jgi:ribosomal protein L14
MQRPDGSLVKFDDNACVLVNKSGDPIGTRMNGQSNFRYTYRRGSADSQYRSRGYGTTRKAMV